MNNKLWIVPALMLALCSTSALVKAQTVAPAPDQTMPPPEQPAAAAPPAEPPATPPPPQQTYVAPAPDQTVTTVPPEQLSYPAPAAKPPSDAGLFAKGRLALSILVGSSFSGDQSYLILGADLGYFLIDGLEIGAGGTFYLFDEPFMLTLSPHIKYVLHMIKIVKPYVGAFYRHYIIAEGFDDRNSLGARLGVYIAPGEARWYFGIGVAYEHLLDCDSSDYFSCDDWYPELSFTIAF